jgi:hypothetical protein
MKNELQLKIQQLEVQILAPLPPFHPPCQLNKEPQKILRQKLLCLVGKQRTP